MVKIERTRKIIDTFSYHVTAGLLVTRPHSHEAAKLLALDSFLLFLFIKCIVMQGKRRYLCNLNRLHGGETVSVRGEVIH